MKARVAEFRDQADVINAAEQDNVQGADGRTGEAEGDFETLRLEFTDNPFSSLIRKVEFLCDTDPQAAYTLLKNAAGAQIFTEPRQLEKLASKMEEVYELARKESSWENSWLKPESEPAPFVGSAFDRSALALPPLVAASDFSPEFSLEPVPVPSSRVPNSAFCQ